MLATATSLMVVSVKIFSKVSSWTRVIRATITQFYDPSLTKLIVDSFHIKYHFISYFPSEWTERPKEVPQEERHKLGNFTSGPGT